MDGRGLDGMWVNSRVVYRQAANLSFASSYRQVDRHLLCTKYISIKKHQIFRSMQMGRWTDMYSISKYQVWSHILYIVSKGKFIYYTRTYLPTYSHLTERGPKISICLPIQSPLHFPRPVRRNSWLQVASSWIDKHVYRYHYTTAPRTNRDS